VERYDNFAEIEDALRISNSEPLNSALGQLDEVDGALRAGERTIIARYQKDLSYVPVAADLAKYRFYRVLVLRIRPGRGAEFAEMRKMWNAAWERSGYKQRRVVYNAVSGEPEGTYLTIGGMESLKAIDESVNILEALGKNAERYMKLYQDIVVSSDAELFVVNPKMSNPPKAYIDADPGFWAPKAATK
jgi:hypothetical protein